MPRTNDPIFHIRMSERFHCYLCDCWLPRANVEDVTVSDNGNRVICKSCRVALNLMRTEEEAMNTPKVKKARRSRVAQVE